MKEAAVTARTSKVTSKDESRQNDRREALMSDLQIRALGRWNQQLAEGLVTRKNGYASYSLMKMLLSRNIMV
jgi:hypothetical protein